MELQQIDRFRAQVLQTAVDPAAQVVEVVRLRDVRRGAPARLRGNQNRLAPLASQPGQQALTAAVPVDVGRVEKIDPEVHRSVQRTQGFSVVHIAPGAANRPGPEANGGNLETGGTQGT
jgi:hypothetical protein